MTVFSLKRLFLVYSLPLVLTLCLLTVFDAFQRPDLFFLDRAFQWRGERDPGAEIAIVAISQEDFERGAPSWPWPRSLLARLVDQVSRHGPAVIAIDILYADRSNTETLIDRDLFAKIQSDPYLKLSGQELRIQARQGDEFFGPGTPGFDRISSGRKSAIDQDMELADAVRRAIDSGVDVVLAATVVVPGGRGIGSNLQ